MERMMRTLVITTQYEVTAPRIDGYYCTGFEKLPLTGGELPDQEPTRWTYRAEGDGPSNYGHHHDPAHTLPVPEKVQT